MNDINKWCVDAKPRLWGFLVRTLYDRSRIDEVMQRTYEYVLTKPAQINDYEKFVRYLLNTAQYQIYNLSKEEQGYLKPTMIKRHGEKIKAFTSLQKDMPDEMFIDKLDRYGIRPDYCTSVGKKELLEFARPVLTEKQFKVLELRLYNYTYAEIAKELSTTSKNVGSHIEAYRARLQRWLC